VRLASPLVVLICAFMLAAFSGFSPEAIVGIAVGAIVILSGYWVKKKIVALAGFLIFAFSASETASFLDLTVLSNIALTGALFVLPLSFSMWFALTVSAPSDERRKINPLPYIWAVLFVGFVLASVPVTGMVLHSTRFTADVGIESEIMLIGFMTAILTVAFIGLDSRR
jgi:hypothetical protein